MIRFVGLTILYLMALVGAILGSFWPPALLAGLLCLALWAHATWTWPQVQDTTTEDQQMTFTPTFEMLELSQRISDDDISAMRDLWALVFPDQIFDPTRPADGIAKDIADKFEEYNKAKEAEDAKESAESGADEFSEPMTLLVGAAVILGAIIAARAKRE